MSNKVMQKFRYSYIIIYKRVFKWQIHLVRVDQTYTTEYDLTSCPEERPNKNKNKNVQNITKKKKKRLKFKQFAILTCEMSVIH